MSRQEILDAIRVPCEDLQGVDKYAPFSYSGYTYARQIDMFSEKFKLMKDAPGSLDMYAGSVTGGLAIWDTAAGIPACSWRKVYEKPGLARPCRGTNKYFDVITAELMRCGPIDRHRWRRPKGEFILDLPSYKPSGWDLLIAAEVMAQHELINAPVGPNPCERIRLWLARLHLGLVLDTPVFDGSWDCYGAGEMLPGTGVYIATSLDCYRPSACVPMSGRTAMVPDATVMVVVAGISYGKLPAGFIKATGVSTPATRWACSPITSVIAGWLPADGVTHMPIVESNESYSLHFQDLEGSDTLKGVVRHGSGMTVQELLTSDLYKSLYACSHPHPVPESLLIRNNINIGLIKPRGKLPDPLDPKNREHKPWIDYMTSLGRIRELIVEASDMYERSQRIAKPGDKLKPELRRARYNRLIKLLHKKEAYSAKRIKKQRDGFLSEARGFRKKEEAIEKEIDQLTQVEAQVP